MNAPVVLVTGGGGYVGTVLVPKLLKSGYGVKVVDRFLYGNFLNVNGSAKRLDIITADIRDAKAMAKALEGVEAVIHLASISNDPCSDLNPALTKQVNLDAVAQLVDLCNKKKVKRLINASSSSVYGVKDTPNVTEDLPLEPITLYARYKAETEGVINNGAGPGLCAVSIRSATVCGYSPRMRLDLSVNILTCAAVCKGEITVNGGDQKRPNIHIEDITDLYCQLVSAPKEKVAGKIFNAGAQNHTIAEIARMVQTEIGADKVKIVVADTNDPRSYHISSERIKKELGFIPKRSILDAIKDLNAAFKAGKIPDALTDIRYYNVKTLQSVHFS